ncbi:MAG: sigma-70 family RNA polymerase sigma factor [Acidobacteriota bacterium]|nr:sigma-70 family RNA polymerase sigma factor [Acidobacteriota bacterium]
MKSDVMQAFTLLESRDAAAREKALGLLRNTVYSFSMNVCGHHADAEDTMQEVLVRALPYLNKFADPRALTTWLYKVARNCCWMSRRRSKFAPREHLSLEELMPGAEEQARLQSSPSRTPESLAISAQEIARLKQAILRVPPSYRIVLVLHDVEELTAEEVSQVLNLKPGTVRVRLHRARLLVRREIAGAEHNAADEAKPVRRRKSAPPQAPRTCSAQCKRIFANLSNYLDGVLDADLCRELERHMSGCPACAAFLDSLQHSVAQTHSLALAGRQRPHNASLKVN